MVEARSVNVKITRTHTSSAAILFCFTADTFHSARNISTDRERRLRAPESSDRKARCLCTPHCTKGVIRFGRREGKDLTGTATGAGAGTGTRAGRGTGAVMGTGAETGTGMGVETKRQTSDGNGDGDGNEGSSGDRNGNRIGDGKGKVNNNREGKGV